MTTGSRIWATVVIIGICGLFALSLVGNGASRAAEKNTRIAQRNTDRTECIRAISNELDHAHWTLVGKAFNTTTREQARVIGMQLASLPLTQDIANRGGSILGEHFDKCPPAPIGEHSP